MKTTRIFCMFCLLLMLSVSCSKEDGHKDIGNQEHKTITKEDPKTEESGKKKTVTE